MKIKVKTQRTVETITSWIMRAIFNFSQFKLCGVHNPQFKQIRNHHAI
jgi:hypothetical protein